MSATIATPPGPRCTPCGCAGITPSPIWKADQVGNVWVASNGPCGLVQIDYETNTLIKFHTPAQCGTPVGVSVDIEGFVWLVDQSGWAWKIDPENPDANNWQQLTITGNHYTYSDMTGGQGKSVILPQ